MFGMKDTQYLLNRRMLHITNIIINFRYNLNTDILGCTCSIGSGIMIVYLFICVSLNTSGICPMFSEILKNACLLLILIPLQLITNSVSLSWALYTQLFNTQNNLLSYFIIGVSYPTLLGQSSFKPVIPAYLQLSASFYSQKYPSLNDKLYIVILVIISTQ